MTRLFLSIIFCVALAAPAVALAGQDIRLDELPAAVRQQVDRMTAGAVIEDVEREKRGDTVYYSVEYEKNDQEWELEITEDGKVMKHEKD